MIKKNGENRQSGIMKLGKNMIIFSIGSFASKMMGYLLLPFYTSILTNQEYGIYDIVITTVNLIFPIFTLLVTEGTMRFALEAENNKKKVFSLSAIIVLASCVLVVGCSPVILLSDTYRPYYLFFVLYYIASTVHTLIAQFVKGIEKTKEFAVSGIVGTGVTLVLNILLMAVIKWGLVGYFIATITGSAFSTIYLWYRCDIKSYICKINKNDFVLLKKMLKYSIPMIPNSLSWWVSTSSDKYIISYVIGAAETGLYSVAYKIPSLMTVFTTIFFNAWQISAVENFGSKKSKEMYEKVYSYFFAFAITVAGIIIAFSKFISKVLFLKDFYAAWEFVPFLILAFVFHDLAAFWGSVYTSSKKTKMLFYSTLLGAGVNIVLNIIVIPQLGGLGGALTTLVSYFLVWLIRVVDVRKIIMIKYKFKDLLCLLLLTIESIVITLDIPYAFGVAIIILLVVLCLKLNILVEVTINVVRKITGKNL